MHSHDGVPLLLGRRHEHAVAEEAGVVDDGIQVPERLQRGLDQAPAAVPVGDVVAVDHGLASQLLYRRDDLGGRAF